MCYKFTNISQLVDYIKNQSGPFEDLSEYTYLQNKYLNY